ncbi:MAG: SCO family protein [Bryobacteraceae bacterium]
MHSSSLLSGAWIMLLSASFAIAQNNNLPTLARGVTIEQKLNSAIPLDLVFRNEANQAVPLRTYFGDKPVVLALVYYGCPNLCSLTLTEMVHALRRVSFEPGRDYSVVVVSFDPSEKPELAATTKAAYAKEFGRQGFNSGWHFLTGPQDPISRLASAVGFRYRWDAPTRQFVHAGGIMVATPDGRLSRYFYGVRYAPADLRLALVEASQEKIGSPVDDLLLFCFRYDAAQGKYTLAIFNVLKLGAALTILGLAGLIFVFIRREKKQKTRAAWREARHVR